MSRKVRSFWGAYEIPDSLDYYLYRKTAPLLRLPLPGFGLLAPLGLLGALLSLGRRGWPQLLILFTAAYIIWFRFVAPEMDTPEHWWFGISPEGIGAVGMSLNFAVAIVVSKFTPAPPLEIQELIAEIRVPRASAKRG